MSSPNKQPVVEAIVSVFETTQNQSWSMFSEKLNNVSNNSKIKAPATSENTITLSSDDIPVFGLVPRLDKVMLVSCNECAMIVKRDCIHSHFYRRHNSNASQSEADKFSLVNFLCTVKTNKNKKLKMAVRKTSEKKINDREKVNSLVNEIKTEFDQEEYERLLKTNMVKIKQENITEFVDHQDIDMVTPSCDPSTSSGVFDWDIKPCIQSLALDHCTDHKVDEKTMEHDTYSNKLSTESLCNKEDLQTNKYLNTQNIEHTVNYVTSSSEVLESTIIDTKRKLTIDFSGFMHSDNKKYYKKHYKYKNKYKKCPYKIKNIKEETKLLIKNEYSEIINNKNNEDNSTFYNQSSNTSAVDVKIEDYKLFSGLQNDCEDTKLFPCYKHLDIKSETPIDSGDSAASYYSPESPKIKEEFQITPKIKEEFQITPKIKEEFQITPNNICPDVKIKEEYDENNDKCKVEFCQSPTELTKCSSDINHSEVLSSTYSGNVDSNLSSISPCSVVSIKEETTFMESSENMNKNSSGDTVISNNQSSIALLDIKEESKYSLTTDFINEESKPSLTTDYINEGSKPSLVTVHTNEESKPSSNVDFINEKSKYPLITDYITDNSYTEYYQLYTDLVPQPSPSYKYLDDELDIQIEEDLIDQLELQSKNNLKVEDDLNDELNFSGEDHLIDKLILQIQNRLSNQLNLQLIKDMKNELNLHVDKDFNDKIHLEAEEELIDEIELPTEDDDETDLSTEDDDDTDWQSGEDDSSIELDDQDEDDLSDELNLQSEDDSGDGLHFQGKEDLNVELQSQSEDSLSDVENLSNEEDLGNLEDMSYGEDLNDEENFSSKENLGSDDIGTNNNLKYDCLVPSQLPNNEEETKCIPSNECSVIINNESSNVTGHDQSTTETLGNEEESKAKSQTDDTYVVIGNDGIVNNFENEYYQYDHEPQTSFTPNYKYSDVISNDSSDSSNDSISSYDQSSVESLDVSDKTDYSSTDTSSESTSDESLYDSESTTSSSTSSSSDQSTILHDITKKTKYTQTNLLEKHEQFMDRIAMLPNSFGRVDGKHNCTQTDVPLECMNCYDSTDDYIQSHSTQIDENSAPINSNVQIDEYGVNNFTPISSSAQIINNKIIPMDVEVYELKDSTDSDFNTSNKSHYSSHLHPHPCNPASQNNNLIHSPINENNCNIFNDELNAYKPNEYTTINEAIPFIKKNNEMYIEFRKVVDKKIVNDRNCKILPFVRIAKNLKKNLKRRVADNKENRNNLLSGSIKKFKAEFIDRDFPCSDESNNNDNVDD